MPFKIYIDESGDHHYSQLDNIPHRYLSLTGTIIEDSEHGLLTAKFNAIKNSIWGDKYSFICFHREDMIHKRGSFVVLKDEKLRLSLDSEILKCLSSSKYKIVCVLLDKKTHLNKYITPNHPYHYCTEAIMSRYIGLLRYWKDVGSVYAETRGDKEDDLLQLSFDNFYTYGNKYFDKTVIQQHISSNIISFYPNRSNIAGLQLSDMLANPIKRFALVHKKLEIQKLDRFTGEILKAVEYKFNRRFSNASLDGYGLVYLSCENEKPATYLW